MISRAEFQRRRKILMELARQPAAIVVPAAPKRVRSMDAFYAYRQDSDLAYLTGFAEPDAVLVLVPGRSHAQSILFCRERDTVRERWDGEIMGPERAVAELGVDDAFPIDDIDDILPNLLDGRERVYFHFGRDPEFDLTVLGWINRLRAQVTRGAQAPESIIALGHLLGDCRLFKSKAELNLLRAAAKISALAHRRVMETARPGLFENQIEAELLYTFRNHNAVAAYEPTVAAGANACTLHYRGNQSQLKAGDLLLVDAGCEVQFYASDITRTIPISGQFSAPQKDLYTIVLSAQNAAIASARSGKEWRDIHDAARDEIVRGLIDLKLVQEPFASALKSGSYKRYFPHKTGHWLGLDVHDTGDYAIDGQSRVLEPDMVLTIEPGIYIDANDQNARKELRGCAIRIEDEVVITTGKAALLTDFVPRSVDAIEALMARQSTHCTSTLSQSSPTTETQRQ
jgi:Xaa-Pro aminopeptidase